MKKFKYHFIGEVMYRGEYQLTTHAFSVKEALRNFHYQVCEELGLEKRVKLIFNGKIISEVLYDNIEYIVEQNQIQFPKDYGNIKHIEQYLFSIYSEDVKKPKLVSKPLVEDEFYRFDEYD